MKRRSLVLLLAGALVFAGGTAVAVYLVDRTISTTGERAVQAMDADERAALRRLEALHKGMGPEQVFRALGPPSQDLVLMAKWNGFGGSPLSQARVYFLDGHAVRVRWMKLGAFVYERNL